MKKTTKLLSLLLALLLCLSLVVVAACNPPESDESDETDETTDETTTEDSSLLLSNGLFATASSSSTDKTDYIKDTITGWSRTSGATSTSSSSDTYFAGVIDLADATTYSNKSDTFGDVANPGIAPSTPKDAEGEYADTNALVLGLPSAASSFYYKNSSSVSLEAGKYYKFSVDVYTALAEDSTADQGAYIVLNSDEVLEMKAINTNKTWKTYTAYIEANNFESHSLTIELWIGNGAKYAGYSADGKNSDDTLNPRLTKGVVFFDNATLDVCDKADYVAASANDKMSLVYVDEGFTAYGAYSYTTTSYSTSKYFYGPKQGYAKNFTGVVGKVDLEDSTDFPSTSTYGYSAIGGTVGIVDIDKIYDGETNVLEKLITTIDLPTEDILWNGRTDKASLAETCALMIAHPNDQISGYGMQSNYNYLIEKNKFYDISVWVYFWAPAYSEAAPTEVAFAAKPEGERPSEAGEAQDLYDAELKAYEEYEEYLETLADYNEEKDAYENAMANAYATLKLTGVSVNDANEIVEKSATGMGEWKQITLHIQGSDLVDRQVGFEFWYGEGEWGSDTLFPGVCFFDNVSINVSDNGADGVEYQKISPITEGDYSLFALNNDMTEDTAELSDPWEFAFADEKSSPDLATAYVKNGKNVDVEDQINIAGKRCNIVVLENKEYTATYLTVKPANFAIAKNAFYRLSMWVKTENVAEDLGAEICVMYAEDDTEVTCLDTVNTDGEWVELSYVFKGAVFSSNEIYIKAIFGSGDIYTPASHIKGNLYMTALTWQEITYTEYSDTSSDDYVAKKELSDDVSTSNTVTNGYFALLNTTNFSSDTDTTDIFDEDGTLIGTAIPASWTATAATTNHISTFSGSSEKFVPQNVSVSNGKVIWDMMDDAECYYVFIGPVTVKNSDGIKTYEKVLLGKTNSATTSFDIPNYIKVSDVADKTADYVALSDSAKVYVQAYNSIQTQENTKQIGLSGFTSATYNAAETALVNLFESAEAASDDATNGDLYNSEFGIIDCTTYTGKYVSKVANLYTENLGEAGNIYYKSAVSNGVLMMASDYYTTGGYKSSSKSISSGSYAKLSVWVKTLDGTKASVTISNSSDIFAAAADNSYDFSNGTNEDFIGFVNVDTNGSWQQFTFYIKNESPSSATVYLELWFGNKYASNTKAPDDGDNKRTIHNGLTKGVVFFDDVSYTTFDDADAFAAAFEGKTANTKYALNEFDGEYYANNTYFQVLDYTTDSFDESSDATYDDQGNTPGNYTHSVDSTFGSDYDSSLDDEEKQTMLYGVYNLNNIADAVFSTIEDSDIGYDVATVKSFLSAYKDGGKNALVMMNLKDNGQSYYSSTITLSSETYYRVTFVAKALIPSGKYGEFRFLYGNDTTKYDSIRITSNEWTEYTYYVGNETDASITSNKIYFYLGSNDDEDAEEATNFTKGILMIDNVAVLKLSGKEGDFATASNAYENLEDKDNASTVAHIFEEEETEEDEEEDTEEDTDDEEEEDEESSSSISSQVWLLIASVVIGAVIIAVVVVFIVRKVKKKIKIAPAPVESKVPVNLAKPTDKKTSTKKDIVEDDDYID